MKKRVLSTILIMIMLVSMLAAFNIPAAAAQIAFTVEPVVLIGGGNEYNIVWENNNEGMGYVTYKYDGKTYTVYDEENGVVRTDDKTHTVRVPAEHLDKAGSYTVHAATVNLRDGYSIRTSDSASWSSEFYGYRKQKKVTMGFISDSHLLYPSKNKTKYEAMLASYKTVVEGYMKRPDIMVLNGDITNELIKQEEYYALLKLISIAGSNGKYPVLYIVGNHEKRGFYSKEIEKYLCYNTGEFYGHFDYGPLSAYIVDIGEDKEDEQEEYGGLIDMERYFDEQLKYFENHPGYTDGATYNFTLGHGPAYVGNSHHAADQSSFANVFRGHGTDFHVCGHNHQLNFKTSTNSVPFPVISDGGHNNNQTLRTTLLTFENGIVTFKGMNDTGGQEYSQTVDCKANGSPAPKAETEQKEEITQTVQTPVDEAEFVPTMAGISTSALKGAADTTANITKPVVFDAGEYYSIVWQTTSGIKCAGYVDVAGVSKTFMDQHGGKLRTETTHSVRIPKETMASGKGYTIKSRVVTNYNGYGMVESGGSNPTAYGPYANGSQIKFAAQPNGKTSKYTILAVANKNADTASAKKVTAAYKSAPNLVVMAGDVISSLNTEKDFGKLLEYAYALTSGKSPVMLLRGENETKGAFAAYLPRILHNYSSSYNINRLYTTYSANNLSVIGLDTATTKPDSDKSYNGFANFDYLRKEQADWIENKIAKSFSSDYNIVFSNATNLTDVVGNDLTKGFSKHKVQLVVSAGSETKFADGGKFYSQATIGDANALLITCKDEIISVETIGDKLEKLGTVDTTAVTYDGQQTAPPIDDTNKPSDDVGGKEDDDDDNVVDDNDNGDDDDDDNDSDDNKNPDKKPDKNNSNNKQPEGDDSLLFGDTVADGWYYDYLKFDIKITDADFTLSGDVTESGFVTVVARLVGVISSSASDWAQTVGILSSPPSDSNISQSDAQNIVSALFTI